MGRLIVNYGDHPIQYACPHCRTPITEVNKSEDGFSSNLGICRVFDKLNNMRLGKTFNDANIFMFKRFIYGSFEGEEDIENEFVELLCLRCCFPFGYYVKQNYLVNLFTDRYIIFEDKVITRNIRI